MLYQFQWGSRTMTTHWCRTILPQERKERRVGRREGMEEDKGKRRMEGETRGGMYARRGEESRKEGRRKDWNRRGNGKRRKGGKERWTSAHYFGVHASFHSQMYLVGHWWFSCWIHFQTLHAPACQRNPPQWKRQNHHTSLHMCNSSLPQPAVWDKMYAKCSVVNTITAGLQMLQTASKTWGEKS